MRILLLRPEDDARASADRLRALGHDVLIAPLIEIVAAPAAPPARDYDALIATSAHAFLSTAPFEALRERPLFVVGARTAARARAAGFARIAEIAPDADRLARSLREETHASYLYLAGRDRRPELEQALRDAGRAIDPLVVYEARALPDLPTDAAGALREGAIDAVLHFSPRSAALFVKRAGKAGLREAALRPAQIAISPRAAEPLKARDVRVAATPDLDGMIACLER